MIDPHAMNPHEPKTDPAPILVRKTQREDQIFRAGVRAGRAELQGERARSAMNRAAGLLLGIAKMGGSPLGPANHERCAAVGGELAAVVETLGQK